MWVLFFLLLDQNLFGIGCKIAVHFTASLEEGGQEIDSSRGEHVSEVDGIVMRKSKFPLMFKLGDGSQIEAALLAPALD